MITGKDLICKLPSPNRGNSHASNTRFRLLQNRKNRSYSEPNCRLPNFRLSPYIKGTIFSNYNKIDGAFTGNNYKSQNPIQSKHFFSRPRNNSFLRQGHKFTVLKNIENRNLGSKGNSIVTKNLWHQTAPKIAPNKALKSPNVTQIFPQKAKKRTTYHTDYIMKKNMGRFLKMKNQFKYEKKLVRKRERGRKFQENLEKFNKFKVQRTQANINRKKKLLR